MIPSRHFFTQDDRPDSEDENSDMTLTGVINYGMEIEA
jgi:hypothetical protein